MSLKHIAIGFLILVAAAGMAQADGKNDGQLQRWYDALAMVEREELGALLAINATIDLKDIGITQTRDEFLASMDEWSDAIAGGSIRHKITNGSTNTIDAVVCYTFTNSAMMTKESFVFEDGQILSSVQQTIATSCDGF